MNINILLQIKKAFSIIITLSIFLSCNNIKEDKKTDTNKILCAKKLKHSENIFFIRSVFVSDILKIVNYKGKQPIGIGGAKGIISLNIEPSGKHYYVYYLDTLFKVNINSNITVKKIFINNKNPESLYSSLAISKRNIGLILYDYYKWGGVSESKHKRFKFYGINFKLTKISKKIMNIYWCGELVYYSYIKDTILNKYIFNSGYFGLVHSYENNICKKLSRNYIDIISNIIYSGYSSKFYTKNYLTLDLNDKFKNTFNKTDDFCFYNNKLFFIGKHDKYEFEYDLISKKKKRRPLNSHYLYDRFKYGVFYTRKGKLFIDYY